MKLKEEYDEKQLRDRGIAYQRAYAFSSMTIIIIFFITDFLEINMKLDLIFNICLYLPAALVGFELIMKNAYDGLNSHYGGYLVSLLLIVGLISLIFNVQSLLFQGQPLAEVAADLIPNIVCVFLGITYWYKQYKNRKDFEDE